MITCDHSQSGCDEYSAVTNPDKIGCEIRSIGLVALSKTRAESLRAFEIAKPQAPLPP